jgi:hypothetical protein
MPDSAVMGSDQVTQSGIYMSAALGPSPPYNPRQFSGAYCWPATALGGARSLRREAITHTVGIPPSDPPLSTYEWSNLLRSLVPQHFRPQATYVESL